MKKRSTSWLTTVAILGTIAALLMLIEFPLWFAPPFYKLDFSEIPVLVGAFALGPIAGMAIEAIKILLNYIFNGTITMGIGEAANFMIGLSFVIPASIIYHKSKTKRHAIIGLIIGVFTMTIIGGILNAFVLLPVYALVYEMPLNDLIALGTLVNSNISNLQTFIFLAVVPFNLLKGILVSIVVILIYKRLSPMIKGKDYDEESI
ncbi:MAG: ECF transporter S component [Firmicutes bacterium]|nr:ECF transporter S component [Bacillota bacterium]